MGFSDPAYAAVCDRTYLPSAAAQPHPEVSLAVVDKAKRPDLPQWTGAPPGLGNVTNALAQRGLRGAYDSDHSTWHIYDPERAVGVQAMESAALRPPWDGSFPARLLIHWAGRAFHSALIHAGTLGHNGTGVLLAGSGGAGKSGTTLSGILHGLSSVGDDYVAVCSTDRGVEAWPVLRLMKQHARGLQRQGLDTRRNIFGRPNWQGKLEFDLEALVPGARAKRLAIKAILIPHIARLSATSFRPASGRGAMMALAPSSLYQLYGNWKEDFGLIASIARRLAAFHMELSEDPAEIADAIRSFIAGRGT
jgi:hypothetical protein